MPVQIGSDNQGCFVRWGDQGHKYYYKCGNRVARLNARKKAIAQGVAIGEFAGEKISFDFDDTLTRASVRETAKRYISKGILVYIISAKDNAQDMYYLTDRLNIPRSRVFATGSNNAKVEKIKSLGITKHYDNNENVIKQLGPRGELVKLSIQERFSEFIKLSKK